MQSAVIRNGSHRHITKQSGDHASLRLEQAGLLPGSKSCVVSGMYHRRMGRACLNVVIKEVKSDLQGKQSVAAHPVAAVNKPHQQLSNLVGLIQLCEALCHHRPVSRAKACAELLNRNRLSDVMFALTICMGMGDLAPCICCPQ